MDELPQHGPTPQRDPSLKRYYLVHPNKLRSPMIIDSTINTDPAVRATAIWDGSDDLNDARRECQRLTAVLFAKTKQTVKYGTRNKKSGQFRK